MSGFLTPILRWFASFGKPFIDLGEPEDTIPFPPEKMELEFGAERSELPFASERIRVDFSPERGPYELQYE